MVEIADDDESAPTVYYSQAKCHVTCCLTHVIFFPLKDSGKTERRSGWAGDPVSCLSMQMHLGGAQNTTSSVYAYVIHMCFFGEVWLRLTMPRMR